MSKDECEFTTKLDESSQLVGRGQNPLKLVYSIMILSTISLPYTAEPTKSQNLHHPQGSSTNDHPSFFYWQKFAIK
jgi:hypothetical protein